MPKCFFSHQFSPDELEARWTWSLELDAAPNVYTKPFKLR